jgi:hypothetical protein
MWNKKGGFNKKGRAYYDPASRFLFIYLSLQK